MLPRCPEHSPMVSVAGTLAGGCRSGAAALGPGPGVRESRGGEEEEGLEVGVLAGGSVCTAEGRAASAVLLSRAVPSAEAQNRPDPPGQGTGGTILHPSPAVAPLPSPGANAEYQPRITLSCRNSAPHSPGGRDRDLLLPPAKSLWCRAHPLPSQRDTWDKTASSIPTAISSLFFFLASSISFSFSAWGFCQHRQRKKN